MKIDYLIPFDKVEIEVRRHEVVVRYFQEGKLVVSTNHTGSPIDRVVTVNGSGELRTTVVS